MDIAVIRTAWIAALATLSVGSVLLRLATALPAPLWPRLSPVTGLPVLSVLVAAAVLPSRVRSLTRVFGIEGHRGNGRRMSSVA